MATTDNAARLHKNVTRDLLDEFRALTPEMTNRDRENFMIDNGVIDASRLYEYVVSLRTGVPVDSKDGQDLADGTNCKLTASYGYVNGQSTATGWRIKVKNCIGDVAALFDHPETGERYEARFPYKVVKGRDYITVTDCKVGGPMNGKWSKYLVKTI